MNKTADENKPVNDSEKGKAYRKRYMREYMKDRRASNNFKSMRMKNECRAATLIANI